MGRVIEGEPQTSGAGAQHRLTRRALLTSSAAAASGLAAPAIAQTISGEIAFATFEWTLPHTGSVLRAISQSFTKKYPDVKVREIPIPSTGYLDQILTQLTAGSPPDIFRIEDAPLQLYMERGYLAPIDDALAEAGIDTSKFAAAAKDIQRNGKTYGVIYQTNPRALIYNKALLAAVGIDGPPKNAQELEQFVQRATKRENGVFGYTIASKAGDVSGLVSSFVPFTLGFGSHFTTPDGRPAATDPRVIEGVKLVKRLWDNNDVPRGLDGPASNKLAFDGKIALTINGSFAIGAANAETKPLMGAVQSPMPSGQVMRGGTWFGATAKGKNTRAAIAWLMHMLTPESQATIARIERVVPAIPSLVPQAIYDETPWFKAFVDAAPNAVSYLPPGLGTKGFSVMQDISDQLENVLYRDKSVEVAMADLQKSMEASLKR